MANNMEDRIKEFQEQSTLAKLIGCVKEFGAYHNMYCCYTSVDRIEQMMDSERQRLWLTKLDACLFDDGIEHLKYGTESERRRTYIKSFMYGSQESAAMWGLYCPTTYKAIRMDISQKAMNALLQNNKVYRVRKDKNSNVRCKAKVLVSDILYAAVEDENHKGQRSNVLYWNGFYSKQLAGLKSDKARKCATGFVKDAEWRFENECRLICKTEKDCGDHIAVDLPSDFFKGVSFILSPWASNAELGFVKERLRKCFANVGMEDFADGKNIFRRSKLENGLQQLAKERRV